MVAKMEQRATKLLSRPKTFTLLQTVATAGVFSVLTGWYGFMIGRESARQELGTLVEDLRSGGGGSIPTDPHQNP